MADLALLSSVVVLTAQLAALGDQADRALPSWLGRRRIASKKFALWGRVARTAVRRRRPVGVTSAEALLVMALPALGIRLQDAATRMRQELPPAAAESGDGAAA
ncbi:hypothetical protein ACFU9X_03820 [Streptomyces atratus]|uniref:hypothetical protein n=1 Tax=Streptomyces atratus TaxID=1893 RepID=UPI0036A70D6F